MKANSVQKNSSAKNVGVWIRVSTEDQAKGDSPQIHEARARAYAAAKGWNVVEVYDLAGSKGWSGKTIREHPLTQKMMDDIRSHRITGLIFSKLARLARNTKELIDMSEEFGRLGADMISLQESIDTSTPSGRFFFTLLAAMGQWEREETTDRINSSFKVRVTQGKLLNRSVPYGYKVVDKQMVLHPEEALIRRQAYELFAQHRRKQTVATMLNDKGYRTRKGRKWKWTQINDILSDPSAKGVYFFNRQKRVGSWKSVPKPEAEWGRIDCEPIVSVQLWMEVNQILEEQRKSWKKPGRLPAQVFSKLIWCACGGKMYARSDSPKYLCRDCNAKIAIADLEEVFRRDLKNRFANGSKMAAHIVHAEQNLKDKEALIAAHQQAIQKIEAEMQNMLRLSAEGQITPQGFGKFYKPAEERLNQLTAELPKLQAEVDYLKINQISAADVIQEANTLYDRWPKLTLDDRRKIAEALCEKVVIGNREIGITYSFVPTSEELCKNTARL